jgi:hypothetical protein
MYVLWLWWLSTLSFIKQSNSWIFIRWTKNIFLSLYPIIPRSQCSANFKLNFLDFKETVAIVYSLICPNLVYCSSPHSETYLYFEWALSLLLEKLTLPKAMVKILCYLTIFHFKNSTNKGKYQRRDNIHQLCSLCLLYGLIHWKMIQLIMLWWISPPLNLKYMEKIILLKESGIFVS